MIQLTFSFDSPEKAAAFLALKGATGASQSTPVADQNALASTKRAPKTTKQAKVVEETNDELDFGDEEEDEKALVIPYTLTDMMNAFKAYAAKTSRDKAGAILKKYKVKSVRELPEQHYNAVMDLIS